MTQAKFNCSECGRLLAADVPATTGYIACKCGSVQKVPWASAALKSDTVSRLSPSQSAPLKSQPIDPADVQWKILAELRTLTSILKEFRTLVVFLMFVALAIAILASIYL